jgi:hypothetical protein
MEEGHVLPAFIAMNVASNNSLSPRWLALLGTCGVNAVKLSSFRVRFCFDRPVIVKRRTRAGDFIAHLANAYFRATGMAIRYRYDPAMWLQTEIACFNLLNAPFKAFASNARELCVDKLPGESLDALIRKKDLTPKIMRAAARELHRVHNLTRPDTGQPFTHGDACLGNFIYDEREDRCRLIDFELSHTLDLPIVDRRADDLAVAIDDIVSLEPRRNWFPLVLAFLHAYGDPEVLARLPLRFRRPRGMGRLLWMVRTNFARSRRVRDRLDLINLVIAKTIHSIAVAVPPRFSADFFQPRPSTNGHASSAGIPKLNSRARLKREIAIAPSAVIPIAPPTRT